MTKQQQLLDTLNQFYHKPIAQVSLELFLSIMTVMFFAAFAIRPTLITMSDLVKEIEDKEKLNDQLTQKVAALSSAQSEFNTWESRLPVLDEALPASPQLVDTLAMIEKQAGEQGLVISNLLLSEVPEEKSVDLVTESATRQMYPLSITVTGNYQQIQLFIDSLIQTRRTMIIDTVTFNVQEDRGKVMLHATITLSIPYFAT